MDALLTLYASLDLGKESQDNHFDMGDEDILSDATLDSDSEQTDMEKQLASLKTYVNAVPYECESVEEMQSKLEKIVGKIFVCVKAKNWFALSTWDGLLQWWLFSSFSNVFAHISVAGYSCGIPCQKPLVRSLFVSTMNYVSFLPWSLVSSTVGPT
jgi:hypothetical protein